RADGGGVGRAGGAAVAHRALRPADGAGGRRRVPGPRGLLRRRQPRGRVQVPGEPMKPATADAPSRPTELRPGRGFDPAALAALFVLTLRQHARGRRLLVLALLFLLPAALAAVVRFAPHPPTPGNMEFVFVLNFIPHALAPLAALLYAAGVIQDEVEEQTLTYLLLRPLPRWALYLTRLAATWLVTALLTGVFTALTYAVIYWGTPGLWGEV